MGFSNNTNTSNGPKDHPRDGVSNNSNASNDRRGVSQNSPANHSHNHHNNNRDLPPVSFYNVPPSAFDPAALAAAASQMPQNGGFDPVALRAFEQLSLTAGSLYTAPNSSGISNPALQYQALLQQSMGRPGPNFLGMPPPMGNYNGGQASQDQYRAGHPGSSPVAQPQQMANNPMLGGMGGAPGVFNPLFMAGYSYGSVPVFHPPQQQGNGSGSGRRSGRVSYS